MTGPGSFFVLGSYAWSVSQTDDGRITVTRVDGQAGVVSGHLPRPYPRNPTVTSVSFATPTVGWASAATNEQTQPAAHSDIWSTDDGGATWALVAEATPVTGPLHLTGTRGWALGDTFLTTRDGGRTWRPVSAPAPFDPALPGRFGPLSIFGQRSVVEVDVPTGMMGYAVFDVTDNGGASWTTRNGPGDSGFNNTGPPLSFAATTADHWVVSQTTRVWATDDAGRHWRLLTDHAGPGSIVLLSYADHLHGWAVAGDDSCSVAPCDGNGQPTAAVYETNDGGSHWHKLPVPET